MLYMDIENLKKVNESIRNKEGEKILKEVEIRMRKIKKEEKLIERIGGEEFEIVYRRGKMEKIEMFEDRVIQEFKDKLVMGGNEELVN